MAVARFPTALARRSAATAPSRFISAVRKLGGGRVVAKRLASQHEPGKRTGAWAKKRLNIGPEFVICGFTSGSNGIDPQVVGLYDGDALAYAARCEATSAPGGAKRRKRWYTTRRLRAKRRFPVCCC